MSCGVSMERYDRGEQENLVLKIFRLKKFFLAHPKSPKTQKIKNFQNMSWGYRWKAMVQENSFKYYFFKSALLKRKQVK